MADARTATLDLQAKPYCPHGACRQVWNSQRFEILVVGPAGTGKTRSDLEKFFLCAMKYPGARILIIRKTRAELSETALVELENNVFPPDWRKWGGTAKRQQRSAYHLPNGSIIVPAGMDDPQKVLSSEWDRILVVEAIQLTEEDYEMLSTRCRATATPYNQIVCETNPGVPSHWLLKRAKAGKMDYFTSTHRDNPKLWDGKTQAWTTFGEHYINVVLSNLTGSRRRRLLEGVWCADEAAVFDSEVLEAHLQTYARDADYLLDIRHAKDGKARDLSLRARTLKDIRVRQERPDGTLAQLQGRLQWWGDLKPDKATGLLRPPQDRVYIIAADVSNGTGSSNSVIVVRDRNTRHKVGEWVSGTVSPRGLARVMATIGYWCGGLKGAAFAIWESNGPGQSTGKVLARALNYPLLYRRTLGADESFETSTDRLGWWSNPQTKRDAVELLRDAYANEEILNPSRQAIEEAMQWIRYPSGMMGPGHLQDETSEAKATHGDRVVADMLSELAMAIDIPTPKAADLPYDPGTADLPELLDDRDDDRDEDDDEHIDY